MFSFFRKARGDEEPGQSAGSETTAPATPAEPNVAAPAEPESRPEPPQVAMPPRPENFDVSALLEPQPAPTTKSTFAPVVADPEATQELKPKVVQVISSVFDPEIPVNIFELGLVYDIRVGADRRVWIDMTLTSPILLGFGQRRIGRWWRRVVEHLAQWLGAVAVLQYSLGFRQFAVGLWRLLRGGVFANAP